MEIYKPTWNDLVEYADDGSWIVWSLATQPAIEKLLKSAVKGRYTSSKAYKVWKRVANYAARQYMRGESPHEKWRKIFNGADRRKAAEAMEKKFYAEYIACVHCPGSMVKTIVIVHDEKYVCPYDAQINASTDGGKTWFYVGIHKIFDFGNLAAAWAYADANTYN